MFSSVAVMRMFSSVAVMRMFSLMFSIGLVHLAGPEFGDGFV
jgi:hypothetical protein